MNIEAYCRWLSRFFFAPGHDADDLAQEARIAAWLCPEHPRLAARRQVLDVIKIARRRPQFTKLHDVPSTADVVTLVEARERLRGVLAVSAPREREALGRVLRGEPIRRHEKALQQALVRARRRLVSCALEEAA